MAIFDPKITTTKVPCKVRISYCLKEKRRKCVVVLSLSSKSVGANGSIGAKNGNDQTPKKGR